MPRSHAALVLLLTSVSLVLSGCSSGNGSSGAPAPTATASLSSSSVTFQGQSASTSSPMQTITLTNSSSVSLSVTNVTVSGDFTQTNNCIAAAVAAGATCTIKITFAPTATGARSGTLTITANVTGGAVTLPLTGTGLPAGAVTLALGSLTFASTYLTTTSAAQNLTLTNTTSSPVYLQLPSVSGDYTIAATTCGVTLAASAGCTVSVAFAPSVTGARAGSFSITDAGGTQTATLSGTGTALPTGTFSGSGFSGKVLAGTTGVIGAAVQVYAAGTSGNGSQGIPLLPSVVNSDSSGAFSIASGYSCPAATSQLYAVARGGKPGASGTMNSTITLISPLGICSHLGSSTQVVLNEATTAVTAWAMAQFLAAGGNIGATATNTLGIANAVASVNNLVNLTTGGVPGANFPATGTAPTARINTVANLLNACAVSSAACATLFTNTTVAGSPAPTNTLDAALNLVRNPGANVSALFTLAGASTVYTPALTAAPPDWTLFVTYGGGGMNSPSGIGVDSKGNIWVASYFSVLSEFTSTGLPVYASGITDPSLNSTYGLAIDPSDNVWIPNEEGGSNYIGSVTVFKPNGTVSGSFSNGGINYPVAITIEPNATAWVVEYGDSRLSLFNSSFSPLSGSNGYGSSYFDFPVAVAVDGNHNGYVANQSDTYVVKVSADGSQISRIDCCNGASGLAVDQGNNVWVANYYGDSVSEISSTGTIPHKANITGGGINHPQGIAVDGAGSVWVTNYRGPALTQIAGASATTPGALISPSAGWAADSKMLEAFAVAIDATGNLWVTNFGTLDNFPTGGTTTGGSGGNFTITEFIGLAAPVKTPMLGPPQVP